MVKKLFLLILVLTVMFVANVSPAFADAPPPVYVDEDRTDANEDGTKDNPYNTVNEAKAFAQAQPSGGYIYTRNANDQWVKGSYIPPVRSGAGGAPFSDVMLYILLFILALVLIFLGWRFQRNSRQLKV